MVAEWILDQIEEAKKAKDDKKDNRDTNRRPLWILESSGHTKGLEGDWKADKDDTYQRDAIRESIMFDFEHDDSDDGHELRGDIKPSQVPDTVESKPLFDVDGNYVGAESTVPSKSVQSKPKRVRSRGNSSKNSSLPGLFRVPLDDLDKIYKPGDKVVYVCHWISDVQLAKYPDSIYLRTLRPHSSILGAYKNGELSWSEYEIRYRDQLTRNNRWIDFRSVVEANSDKRVLVVCHCSLGDNCHIDILLDDVGRNSHQN